MRFAHRFLISLLAVRSLHGDQSEYASEDLSPAFEENIHQGVDLTSPDDGMLEIPDNPQSVVVPPGIDSPPTPDMTEIVDTAHEFSIHLKNPVFTNGVIATDQGGIVSGQGIRIQAQKIEYTNKIENGKPVKKIVADGDLMMQYGESYFVGSHIEYDFVEKTGTLLDGKTFVDVWFLGGEKILFKPDGSYYIYNAYITTSESQDHLWDVHAGAISITKEHLFSAKNIKFRFTRIPLFWLPKLRTNLKFLADTPIKYKLTWDTGLGPRATMRYRFFSWEDLNMYFRLDYRLKRGFGSALEGDYRAKDKRTLFLTKNYVARDKTVPDEQGKHRYRFQGLYSLKRREDKTRVHMVYDKISDDKMPSDFKSDDFEIDTQKRTRLLVTDIRDDFTSSLSFQPRINRFQSIDQELPLVNVGVRPFELGQSGILFENAFNAGYLNYVFMKSIQQYIPHRSAARAETQNKLYRPIPMGPVTVTPTVGVIGIFYSNNPEHESVGQGLITYGWNANTSFGRSYSHWDHQIEPYLNYEGLSRPLAATDKPFIFSLDDGYNRLNMVRVGMRHSFFSLRRALFSPSFTADVHANGFFGPHAFHRTFPKAYASVGWTPPSFALSGGIAYNFEETLWDYTNIRGDVTVNEDLAMGIEFRHRSRFDWQKADHQNFILDVTRPISELLHSPLSDGRNTFLSRLFLRFSPDWSMLLQSHHGWGRKTEPWYNEINVDLFTMLTSAWRLKVTYRYIPNDPFHLTAGITLVK